MTMGWLAMNPIDWPSRRANPTSALGAQCGCTSRIEPASNTIESTWRMSYADPSSAGTIEFSGSSMRSGES